MSAVLLLAGPSAVGKTTVMNLIIESDARFASCRSATTRPPRGDGHDGEYVYLTRDEFLSVMESEMLEHTEFGGNLYGTPRSEISALLNGGKTPVLVLDLNGITSFKTAKRDFDVFAVYIYDDISVMRARLIERERIKDKDSDPLASATFLRRMDANISDYMRLPSIADQFDLFIKNNTAKETAEEILKAFYAFDTSRRNNSSFSDIAASLAASAAVYK